MSNTNRHSRLAPCFTSALLTCFFALLSLLHGSIKIMPGHIYVPVSIKQLFGEPQMFTKKTGELYLKAAEEP